MILQGACRFNLDRFTRSAFRSIYGDSSSVESYELKRLEELILVIYRKFVTKNLKIDKNGKNSKHKLIVGIWIISQYQVEGTNNRNKRRNFFEVNGLNSLVSSGRAVHFLVRNVSSEPATPFELIWTAR